jgi:hypothetical protein
LPGQFTEVLAVTKKFPVGTTCRITLSAGINPLGGLLQGSKLWLAATLISSHQTHWAIEDARTGQPESHLTCQALKVIGTECEFGP